MCSRLTTSVTCHADRVHGRHGFHFFVSYAWATELNKYVSCVVVVLLPSTSLACLANTEIGAVVALIQDTHDRRHTAVAAACS